MCQKIILQSYVLGFKKTFLELFGTVYETGLLFLNLIADGKQIRSYEIALHILCALVVPQEIFGIIIIYFTRDYEILGWCPVGTVLPHGEKIPL